MSDQEFWKFFNSFAPWFSAIGTVLAVYVSLYLARTKARVQIEAVAGIRLVSYLGIDDERRYFSVAIVNTGPFDVEITGISISNVFKRTIKYFLNFDSEVSSDMPVRLSFGQGANYFVPLDDKDSWLKFAFNDHIQPFPKIMIHTVQILVNTSINKQFRCVNTLKRDILRAINL
jgi:hypothetical protein